jgi:hypothetical protein
MANTFDSKASKDEELNSLPRWNEIFFGRHKNKISFVATLRKLGYHFFYILHQFIVHQEHDFSLYRKNSIQDHNKRMESAFHHQVLQVQNMKVSKKSSNEDRKIDIFVERKDVPKANRLKYEDLEEFVL